MDIGFYNNFPTNIHYVQSFISTTTSRQLQRCLIKVLGEVNCKETSFEEIALPTIPNGTIIFEFGIAEMGDFNFLAPAEVARVVKFLANTQVNSLDFFCSIRYYKINKEKRQALKFDYYMLRLVFSETSLQVRVFHERGPRYISPEDLVEFIVDYINRSTTRKMLITPQNI